MTRPDGPTEVRVDGPAAQAWLDALHDGLARLWEGGPAVPDADRLRFETAVVEIATNVVRHARPADPGDAGPVRASVLLRVGPDLIEAEIRDGGRHVVVDLDPAPVDEMAESGRGIALARAAVDRVSLAREGADNVWRLTRRWAG